MFNKATIRVPIPSLKHFEIISYVIKDDELIIELIENNLKNKCLTKIENGELDTNSQSPQLLYK
jgi:hypothetical protein